MTTSLLSQNPTRNHAASPAQPEAGRKALWIGIGFLLLLILGELAAILYFNSGKFIYTLDDPYIHLALAENIRQGHYGINLGELSAPSSSILWPFLLAPFSALPHNDLLPLLLNILAAVLSALYFWKILQHALPIPDPQLKNKALAYLLIFLILGTNTVGLVFSGMEHSGQLLLAVMILYYLILEAETSQVSPWLGLVIVLAPLIRYENLGVSLAALLYLFLRRRFKLSLALAGLLALFLGGFSIFLVSLGFGPFPTSVVAKSTAIANPGLLKSTIANLFNSLQNGRGALLALGLLFLVGYALFAQGSRARRQLAVAISLAVFLHLCFGRYGWYFRYEIYIWAVTLLALIYLSKGLLAGFFIGQAAWENTLKLIAFAELALLLTGLSYIVSLATIPLAANNIYEQHYQMHRFVVDYYRRPVAVNDIGYVSYQNDQYVLDLYGLASAAALDHRLNDPNLEWMNDLASAHAVELAMVYDSWLNGRPANWIKLGELHLSKLQVTPASTVVSFYALNPEAAVEITQALQEFIPTLPPDTVFQFTP